MSATDAKAIIEKLLKSMNIDASVDIDSDYPIYLSINSDDSALLIGKKGESLRALQSIINTIYKKQSPDGPYVGIDVAGYKKERVEKVQAIAQRLADEARVTGEPQHLKPMNAFERRSVHALLAEQPDITTESEGSGLDRHIVIKKR